MASEQRIRKLNLVKMRNITASWQEADDVMKRSNFSN